MYLFILYVLEIKNKIPYKYFVTITLLGLLLAVYFIFLQIFIIGKICSTCFIIDFFAMIIAILSFNNKPKK